MKTILSILTITLLSLTVISQTSDALAQQLQDDASFLSANTDGDDGCYSFVLGEIMHEGGAIQEISAVNVKDLFVNFPVIIAKTGCTKPTTVNLVKVTVTYSNGYAREFSVEEMDAFKETPDMVEKFMHNAVTVTFSGINFSDDAGVALTLKDKVFEIK